jgi:hypothetical protein
MSFSRSARSGSNGIAAYENGFGYHWPFNSKHYKGIEPRRSKQRQGGLQTDEVVNCGDRGMKLLINSVLKVLSPYFEVE